MAFGWDDALMIGAPILGGALGNMFSSGDASAARDAYRNALRQFENISTPELKELALSQYGWLGDYNPLLGEAINLGPSEQGQIALNPEIRAQKMQALADMHERALRGFTPADEARFAQISKDAGALARAQAGQIDMQMAQRGQGSSGSNYIQQLLAGQQTANRAQDAGLQTAIARDNARQQGLQGWLSGLSQQSQEEFNAASQAAQARDMFARINNAQQNQVAQQNIASQNQYGFANQQGRQNIANQNVGLMNQQQMYNRANLPQQNFQNQMSLAQARAGAYGGYGNQMANQAANTAAMWSGIGKGISGGMAGWNQMQSANALNQSKVAANNAQANYYNSLMPKTNRVGEEDLYWMY